MAWGSADIPRLSGRTFVVTGANSGIGYHAALELARRGGQVVLACRNVERGEAAVRRIRQEAPDARTEVMPLDLADLASVRAFADALAERHKSLACLINNAGVMAVPRAETVDGFELQFGVNHLGHFALTGRLMPLLLRAQDARVVTVTSLVYRSGRIRMSDLQWAQRYARWAAYAQSKLANLLFALELDRRLRAGGHAVRSIACHPGYAATNLQHVAPRQTGRAFEGAIMRIGNGLFAQSAAGGALPTLMAATAPQVQGGQVLGPRVAGLYGAPRPEPVRGRARDPELAARLWEVSQELTGVQPLG